MDAHILQSNKQICCLFVETRLKQPNLLMGFELSVNRFFKAKYQWNGYYLRRQQVLISQPVDLNLAGFLCASFKSFAPKYVLNPQ